MKEEEEEQKTQETASENTEETQAENTDAQVENEAEAIDTPEIEAEPVEELSEEEKLRIELDELKDKHLRLSAEFDNYRRRTVKEKMDIIKSGGEEVLRKILPVVDDFDRAIQHLDDAQELSAVKEGVMLIYNKFQNFKDQNGLKEIEAKELEFDVDHHEALTKIPAPTPELKGKVVDVVEKGYMLNDKVIRFAKVVVGE